MIYLFFALFLATAYADICSQLGCPPCVGASGICCGQGNVTINGVPNQTMCSSICLPDGYTCCGCNPRFSTDPDVACFGCGGVIAGIQQYCTQAPTVNTTANLILDYYCTHAATHVPNWALVLFVMFCSLALYM